MVHGGRRPVSQGLRRPAAIFRKNNRVHSYLPIAWAQGSGIRQAETRSEDDHRRQIGGRVRTNDTSIAWGRKVTAFDDAAEPILLRSSKIGTADGLLLSVYHTVQSVCEDTGPLPGSTGGRDGR